MIHVNENIIYYHFIRMIFLMFKNNNIYNVQGVPKKRGISECYHVCFIDHSIWSLEYSFFIHLKIEIHVLFARTKPCLSNIRELKNIYHICVFITFNYTVVNCCVKLGKVWILLLALWTLLSANLY